MSLYWTLFDYWGAVLLPREARCASYSWIIKYRIRLNATPGLYFSLLVFRWGSIQIWTTWGCIQAGVLLIISILIELNIGNDFLLENLNINEWYFYLMKYSSRCSFIASIHRSIHVPTLYRPFYYSKSAPIDMGGVVFKMGLYCFKINFWLGLY